MTTKTPLITGTDFVTVATKDYDTAAEFYGEVLGLPFSKRWGNMPAGEFETGTLTIAVMQSDAFGMEFRPNNHPIALHVDDVAAGKPKEADVRDSDDPVRERKRQREVAEGSRDAEGHQERSGHRHEQHRAHLVLLGIDHAREPRVADP